MNVVSKLSNAEDELACSQLYWRVHRSHSAVMVVLEAHPLITTMHAFNRKGLTELLGVETRYRSTAPSRSRRAATGRLSNNVEVILKHPPPCT